MSDPKPSAVYHGTMVRYTRGWIYNARYAVYDATPSVAHDLLQLSLGAAEFIRLSMGSIVKEYRP